MWKRVQRGLDRSIRSDVYTVDSEQQTVLAIILQEILLDILETNIISQRTSQNQYLKEGSKHGYREPHPLNLRILKLSLNAI
jgi:hypothetical protein